MFESELEFEKRESSVVPPLLIVALIIFMVGVSGYFVWQNKQVLSTADAGNLITATLKPQGPAVVRFHAGLVKASVEERIDGPHYRLLERLAWCVWVRQYGCTTPTMLTAQAQERTGLADRNRIATE